MTLEELYKKLEMDGPADMEYFEQFADLLEADEEIPFDLFYIVLSEITPENAGELVENYFEDLTKAAPDDEDDLVLLFDSLQQNLMLLAQDLDGADARRSFAEQLYKFREWYKKPGSARVDGEPVSLFEAMIQAREDALSGGSHELDLSGCLDFKLDDASYGLGSFSEIDITADGENSDESDA